MGPIGDMEPHRIGNFGGLFETNKQNRLGNLNFKFLNCHKVIKSDVLLGRNFENFLFLTFAFVLYTHNDIKGGKYSPCVIRQGGKTAICKFNHHNRSKMERRFISAN